MSQMLSLYEQTLTSAFNLIDLNVFLKVVQLLYQAQHILLFPTVGNIFMAESFQQNMMEIGQRVELYNQSYYQHWAATSCQQGDVALIISYANRSPWLMDVMHDLKSTPAKVILISSTRENQLSQYADYHLHIFVLMKIQRKIACFSSRASFAILIRLYICMLF